MAECSLSAACHCPNRTRNSKGHAQLHDLRSHRLSRWKTVDNIRVSVKQIDDLSTTPTTKNYDTTGIDGTYSVTWSEASTPASPWDLFVEADDQSGTIVESRLLRDLAATAEVDLIVGAGAYEGRSEWDRVSDAIEDVLGSYDAKDVVPSRLEWVARRADVFPTLAAAYVQAHRMSDGRTVEPETCYALLRHGLGPDLPSILRVGEGAWESALRAAWSRKIVSSPGDDAAQDARVVQEVAAIKELVVLNATYSSATGVNRYKILDTAPSITPADQTTFNEAWVDHTGTLTEFWDDLAVVTVLDQPRSRSCSSRCRRRPWSETTSRPSRGCSPSVASATSRPSPTCLSGISRRGRASWEPTASRPPMRSPAPT